MFTGVITHMGQVRSLSGDGRLCVEAAGDHWGTPEVGTSIAVDGVCLTVTRAHGNRVNFDVSRETRECTTIGSWSGQRRVNLERPLVYGGEVSGHFVSGHVDCAVAVLAVNESDDAYQIVFDLPPDHAPCIVRKGSVCINGVSLTVNDISLRSFDVNIIPHTLARTNLADLRKGRRVNLETDILSRYMANLLR